MSSHSKHGKYPMDEMKGASKAMPKMSEAEHKKMMAGTHKAPQGKRK